MAFDCDSRLIGPSAAKLPLFADKYGTRIGINKKLRHVTLCEPIRIIANDLDDIGRLSVDRNFPRPRQGRAAPTLR